MAINLGDVRKNGIKVKAIDEENEVNNITIEPTITPTKTSQKNNEKKNAWTQSREQAFSIAEKELGDKLVKKDANKTTPSAWDIIVSPKIDIPTKIKYLQSTIGNTATASSGISAKTIVKEGENTLDTLNNLSSKVNSFALNLAGQKELAKKEKENARNFIQRNLTEELSDYSGLNKKIENAEKGGSIITRDNAGGKIVQGVSQMMPRIAMSYALGVPEVQLPGVKELEGIAKIGQIAKNIGTTAMLNLPSNIAMGGSVYGSSLEEAYNAGATEEQAVKYAIGNTATEIATEWITGGIPGTNGVGGLDLLANKGIDKISNQFVKELAKYGYKMVGEGAEEALAEIISPYLKNATYSKGEQVDWKAVLESAIYGGITSGILELPSTINNVNAINQNKHQYNQSIAENAATNIINKYGLEKTTDYTQSSLFSEFGKKVEQESQNNISSNLAKEVQTKTRKANQDNINVQFMPIEDILPYQKSGGYRTSEQMQNLTDSIKKDGIINPIKLVEQKDGKIEVYNGNHRLQVAKELGLTEIPVIFEKPVDFLKGEDYTDYRKYVEGDYNGERSTRGIENIIKNDDRSRNIERSSNDNSWIFGNRRGNARNDRLSYQMEGYNNGSPSNTAYRRNIEKKNEIENTLYNADREYINQNDNTNIALIEAANRKTQNKGSLQNAPIVDTFAGAPVYQKSDGTKTFFRDDVSYSDQDLNAIFKKNETTPTNQNKSGNKQDTMAISHMSKDLVNKMRQTGLDIINGAINIDDVTSNHILNNNVGISDVKKISEIIEYGNAKKLSNDIAKIEYKDGQTNYELTVLSKDGELNVVDLKKTTGSMPDISNQKTIVNENKTNDTLKINDDVDDNIKELTSKTTSEEINQELNKEKGQSKFYENITKKSEFISEDNRMKLSQENDLKYYEKVSNKESLDRAKVNLEQGGEYAINEWFNSNKKSIDSTDTATGWILLKQYQDAGNYNGMVQVAKKMREMGTKAGQTIQMYNVLERLTPEGMVKYAQSELTEAYEIQAKGKSKEWINKNREAFDLTPDETKFIVDTMKKVEKMSDGYPKRVELAKIQSMLQNKMPPAKGAGMKAWMRISMLFNPKTQARNVIGNAIITPVNTVADAFSAMVDKQIAKKTGKRTTGNMNAKVYAQGFKQGVYESYNDFKQDINTRDIQNNRFEVGQGKSFNEKTVIGKTLNRTDKLLSFVLDVGDRGFYEGSFTNSINNQLVLNNTTTVTQDMIDIATNEALSRTWQDNNNYTRLVLNARNGLNKINVNGYGLGDVLIPFAKTPANLTKAIIDYSPASLVKTLLVDAPKFKNSLENGQYTVQQQHKFVQKLGKATAGSLLYIAGYALAKAKMTTGKSDDDKDVANFMKNTLGVQSYSIKIGNKSFTYDWAQPIAAPFAITADLVNNSNDSANLLEKITATLDTPLNIILEQSFMSSIQDVLTDYDGIASGLINQVLDLPARATPTFLKQINDMIDSTQRSSFEKGMPIESAKNSVKAKIPILSKDLSVSRDSLGREIKKYGGDNNLFNVFLNPANTNKGKVSESAQEIYKVYQQTGDKTIMPRVAPYSISLNKKTKTLTSKERSEFQKISGEIVENNIKELAKNKRYQKLSAEDKAIAIKGIVDYAYNKAKAGVLDTDIAKAYKTADRYANRNALYDYYANNAYKNREK